MLPNFAVLPPEVNSARVFAGAGSAPMLAAAAAWDDLASELQFNLVHGSDSAESAQREIALWFPGA